MDESGDVRCPSQDHHGAIQVLILHLIAIQMGDSKDGLVMDNAAWAAASPYTPMRVHAKNCFPPGMQRNLRVVETPADGACGLHALRALSPDGYEVSDDFPSQDADVCDVASLSCCGSGPTEPRDPPPSPLPSPPTMAPPQPQRCSARLNPDLVLAAKVRVEVCALRAQRERGGKRKLACKPRACRAQRVCSPCSSLSSRLSTTVVDQKNSSESSK